VLEAIFLLSLRHRLCWGYDILLPYEQIHCHKHPALPMDLQNPLP
jgi:hypothetical protein